MYVKVNYGSWDWYGIGWDGMGLVGMDLGCSYGYKKEGAWELAT